MQPNLYCVIKESIHIKNFSAIQEIHIKEIKPITVLIGESASGKSTFMKVLALFRWLYKRHKIMAYLRSSKISKSPFRFRMETYLKNCGFEKYLKKDTEITYTVCFDDERHYSIRFPKGKLGKINDEIATKDLRYNKLSFISETRNLIPYMDR